MHFGNLDVRVPSQGASPGVRHQRTPPPEALRHQGLKDNSRRFQAALDLEAGMDPAEREEDQEPELHRQTIQAKVPMHVDIEQDTNRTCTHSNSGGAVGWMVGQICQIPWA